MGPEVLLLMQVAGAVISTVDGVAAASGQEEIANSKARLQTAQVSAQIAQEEAQSAIEATQRERRLTAALASQRAAAGGIVELSSGSFLRLQETTIGTLNREQRIADFVEQAAITNLNLKKEDIELNRIASVNAAKSEKQGAIFKGIGEIGGKATSDNFDLIKNSDLLGGA